MGHHTTRDAYKKLEDRINWFTQGAAPSETLTKILQVLFTEKEAKWVSRLPVRPFTLKKAARIWGTTEFKAEKLLDHLCEKGLMVDSYYKGQRQFVLPPPMIGFFEFSLMRTRGDIDQKLLSELFHQYLNVEEDFIKDLFFNMDTQLGRVFAQEPILERSFDMDIDISGKGSYKSQFESVLSTEKTNHILDYERASHIIDEAEYIGVGTCYCRHKNYHLGIECQISAPMETCLTFNNVARSLAEHGAYTRLIDKAEAKDILTMAYECNLVQMGENVKNDPAFMCNCCGCCCEALGAAKRFSPVQPIASSNFLPRLNQEACRSCGKCAKVCPIDAIKMVDYRAGSLTDQPANGEGADKVARKGKLPVIDKEICLGCGICARNCSKNAIMLERRPIQIITPVNTTHRFVMEAIEKGTLQNLIFDNQAFASHRAMAAVFGTILKLPPVKQAMASKQFKSVYLERLLSHNK